MLLIAHDPTHESGIPDVPADHTELGAALLRQIVQPAVAVEGVVKTERGHIHAARQKRLGQMGPDEPIGSCHENIYAIVTHACFPSVDAGRRPSSAIFRLPAMPFARSSPPSAVGREARDGFQPAIARIPRKIHRTSEKSVRFE